MRRISNKIRLESLSQIIRNCFVIVLALFSYTVLAQISFEPGYIIDRSGRRTDCQILYKDWLKNPRIVEFVTEGKNATQKLTTDDLLEFGVTGKCVFKSAKVSIDLSSNNASYAGTNREPEWKTMTIFLRVLVKGKASLFYYQDSQIRRFYYSLDEDTIIPLVNHPYVVEKESAKFLLLNESFRQQLLTVLNCGGRDFAYFESLEYSVKSMVQFFIEYNKCNHSEFTEYGSPSKGRFYLKITAGCNNSYFSAYNSHLSSKIILFDSKIIPSGGLEAEYLFPFLRNKWSLVIAPAFERFESTAKTSLYNYELIYQNVYLPFGLRYSLYLRKTPLRFYFDTWFVPGFILDFNSELKYGNFASLEIMDGSSYALGAGIEWNRFSFSYRFYGPIDILRYYSSWINRYNRISFSVGYRFY